MPYLVGGKNKDSQVEEHCETVDVGGSIQGLVIVQYVSDGAGGYQIMEQPHLEATDSNFYAILDNVEAFILANNPPVGTGTNGSVTLTNADTIYAVPSSAPTANYVLVLYNGSDTDMFWGYQNSNANGILFRSGATATFDIGANQQIYTYCSSGSKVITYTTKEIPA